MTSRPYFNSHRQRWQAVVELGRDERGKRKQIFRDMPKEKNTKAEAKRVWRTLLNELEAGTFVQPTDLTVAEYLASIFHEGSRVLL